MSDRIPCINPRCRRTAAADKYEPGEEIICRTCFRALPKSISERYKTLRARDRRIDRRVKKLLKGKAIRPAQLNVLSRQIDRLSAKNWQAMREFFRPVEKPAGLDSFLEEVGL